MDRGAVFSNTASNYYDHLTTLCGLIDRGDASIGLPPYNGGLFAPEAASLLERVRLPDSAVALIVYDLSHAETVEGRRFINYRDMSVQQLGSIYERLLEREPIRDELGRIIRPPQPLRAEGQRQLLHAPGARRPDRGPYPEAAGRRAARHVRKAGRRAEARPPLQD